MAPRFPDLHLRKRFLTYPKEGTVASRRSAFLKVMKSIQPRVRLIAHPVKWLPLTRTDGQDPKVTRARGNVC
jgi:hypothetical protein